MKNFSLSRRQMLGSSVAIGNDYRTIAWLNPDQPSDPFKSAAISDLALASILE